MGLTENQAALEAGQIERRSRRDRGTRGQCGRGGRRLCCDLAGTIERNLQEEGSRTIYDRAHERVEDILSSHYPEHLDPAVDAKIRERFPIRLDPADMRPGNGRW